MIGLGNSPVLLSGGIRLREKKATAASKEPNSAPEALLQNKHFAAGVNFYKLVWVFIIGCVLGFVIEEAWCLLTKHVWESRKGLIYGPFSQVYGFGAVLMTLNKVCTKDTP